MAPLCKGGSAKRWGIENTCHSEPKAILRPLCGKGAPQSGGGLLKTYHSEPKAILTALCVVNCLVFGLQ